MEETELNKFILKFKVLWKSGLDAHLDLDCHAGQAWVGLRLRLGGVGQQSPRGHGVDRHFYDGACRVGGSRLRRRERQAAERQQAEVEAVEEPVNVGGNECVKIHRANADPAESIETTEEVVQGDVKKLDTINVTAVEATHSDCGTSAEILHGVLENNVKDKNDSDMYVFGYWNLHEVTKAQEAIDHIEQKLIQSFKTLKVKECDQVYKVDGIESLEDNEIQVKIKLKKSNRLVEQAARNIQTYYQPENPNSVTIKYIQR